MSIHQNCVLFFCHPISIPPEMVKTFQPELIDQFCVFRKEKINVNNILAKLSKVDDSIKNQ